MWRWLSSVFLCAWVPAGSGLLGEPQREGIETQVRHRPPGIGLVNFCGGTPESWILATAPSKLEAQGGRSRNLPESPVWVNGT